MRLDKPIGTLLLLWPTLWALWFAGAGRPHWLVTWIFILGTFLMRSAGCIINDVADRNFDGHVERTRNRPLPAGDVNVKEALWLFVLLSLLSLCLVLLIGDLFVLGLAAIGLFVAITYPLTKRFFALPQAYLGIAFGFGIPMAYAALLGHLPGEAWLLLGANVFWSLAYDTEYAMVDRNDDLKIGIRTSAITFGRFDVVAVMGCYAGFLSLVGYVGYRHGLGWPFWVGMAVAASMVVYHYFLIRDRDRDKCFYSFRHNNYVGMVIFIGVVAAYELRIAALGRHGISITF